MVASAAEMLQCVAEMTVVSASIVTMVLSVLQGVKVC